MKFSRLITFAVLAGVTVLAVTFLTAANNSTNGAGQAQDSSKATGTGAVVFANVDFEPAPIPLFPKNFPQPTEVVEVLVKEGEYVTKGKPLIKLDAEMAEWTLEEAREGLKTAESALAGAKALLENAKQYREGQLTALEAQQIAIDAKKKTLEAAKTKLAEQELRARQQGIKNDGEINAARFTLESAQKDVEFEEKKLQGLRRVSAMPNINAAQSKVDEASSAVRRQKILLKKAEYGVRVMTITAPADGKVLRNLCQSGLAFGAQSKQPLMWFQPTGKLVIRCEVDQEWAGRVLKNQSATITDDSIPDDSKLNKTWNGKVTKIADSFLPKRAVAGLPEGFPMNDTRVLEVLVELNKGENPAGLRLGQRVKVKIGME